MRWRWRGARKKGPGRPPASFFLHSFPQINRFIPQPQLSSDTIKLSYPEYEVLRLIDLEGLSQEEAAKKMKTSRGTIWRLLTSARKKITLALTEGRPIIICKEG